MLYLQPVHSVFRRSADIKEQVQNSCVPMIEFVSVGRTSETRRTAARKAK